MIYIAYILYIDIYAHKHVTCIIARSGIHRDTQITRLMIEACVM